jgi:enediyne biosynthesis protein E4
MAIGRRHWWWVLAIVLLGATIVAGWRWWQGHRLRHAITEIESEMAAGRHGIAARRLTELPASASGYDEAAYLLGACERSRGRNHEAEQAWARVAPASSFFSRAVSERLSLLIDTGRFTNAEQAIDEAVHKRPQGQSALRILLVPLLMQQGRTEDAQRLVEERWQDLHETGEEATELAVNLGRLSLDLHWSPAPVEAVRASLDAAAALNPGDDRVWLGQANLAIRAGSLDSAERLLDACLKSRPDDAPVWRARLNWAMAANRGDEVRRALSHLPVDRSTPA